MNNTLSNKLDQKAAIQILMEAHSNFQAELDFITAYNNDPHIIDTLITLRQFNIDCIQRYTSMLIQQELSSSVVNSKKAGFLRKLPASELLWQVNTHLSRLIPIYSSTIIEANLDQFVRMIVAQNMDKVVKIRDNFLHPINEEAVA